MIVIWLAIYNPSKPKPNHHITSDKDLPDDPSKEGFQQGNDFHIYNYLNKSIRLELLELQENGISTGKPITLSEKISPHSKQGFSMETIEKYLIKGNKLVIYTFVDGKPGLGEDLYSTYEFEIPPDTTVKMLHVGMITARWMGADADYNIGKPGLNAVQGMPWIKIHNTTDFYIALNNNINISPGGTLRYTGRDHFGVRLGTVFKDQSGTFPDYIFTVPATDVYYGVVSDIQQPLFGGFQLTPDFNDDPTEPQYLLEEGWMGGPATSKIPAGLLPIEGPAVLPQNRWGEVITDSGQLITPVGPPLELNTDM